MAGESEPPSVALDALFAELLRAGESRPLARAILARGPDERLLLALLRRAVPTAFLEELACCRPWSERPRVLARIVLSPRAPRALSLRLVGALYWRDLAEVAASLRLSAAVRVRAEWSLREGLPQMRLGDKITLARVATAPVLSELLADPDAHVLEAALTNARLREEDLARALRREDVRKALLEQVCHSSRWASSYVVRLALVLQPRTPLALALQQITALIPRDLRRVAENERLHPLVSLSARAVLERGEG